MRTLTLTLALLGATNLLTEGNSMADTKNLPDVWGSGFLFAFSGMDGETSWRDYFVLTGDEPLAFQVHSPNKTSVKVRFLAAASTDDLVTLSLKDPVRAPDVHFTHVSGGLVEGNIDIGDETVMPVTLVWRDQHTLAGEVAVAEGGNSAVFGAWLEGAWTGEGASLEWEQHPIHFALPGAQAAPLPQNEQMVTPVYVEVQPGASVRFTLSLQKPIDPATVDVAALASARKAFFDNLPVPRFSGLDLEPSNLLLRTWNKAASIMKVNCMSPEARIESGWTTPDRVPHRHMWIWDSAFHAQGLKHIAPNWAEDAIRAVYYCQREDGFIPHTMTPDGSRDSKLIQPPILAWAALDVYRVTGNKNFLRAIYEPNKRFLDWIRANYDQNGDGLYEWTFNGPESGMDNSPRFADKRPFNALDLNCFIANDYRVMAEIAEELGESPVECRAVSEELGAKIREAFWNAEAGYFFDRTPDGAMATLKTPCGVLPLFAGIATPEQAEAVRAMITDPETFWTGHPVASVALDEEVYEKDMWRGPTWVNYNYLIARSLQRYGFNDDARALVTRNIEQIARWYEHDGAIYEFYDAEADESPKLLFRKGRRGGHWLNVVIPDYHWSAGLYVAMAREEW